MQNYTTDIENFWLIQDQLINNKIKLQELQNLLSEVIAHLNIGKIRVCVKENSSWIVNDWIRKAILLYIKFSTPKVYKGSNGNLFDKIPSKFEDATSEEFINMKIRSVPGSYIRTGAFIGKQVILMPSFVNIGAYIDDGTMVDTWSTIGSCAQIGKNCHISGGVGIGGVLEPLSTKPVIIEDNCFIGARSEIAEGVIIEQGSVIGMGVYISASTKIVYRNTGEIIYGRVPPYSVVVPGSMPSVNLNLPSLYCAVIIKTVDEKTKSKVQLNDLLRD